MNAVSASHDTHLLKIDNKVDKKKCCRFLSCCVPFWVCCCKFE